MFSSLYLLVRQVLTWAEVKLCDFSRKNLRQSKEGPCLSTLLSASSNIHGMTSPFQDITGGFRDLGNSDGGHVRLLPEQSSASVFFPSS